jgi:hypothetical protein
MFWIHACRGAVHGAQAAFFFTCLHVRYSTVTLITLHRQTSVGVEVAALVRKKQNNNL